MSYTLEFDSLPEDDPRRDDIHQIQWELVELGVAVKGSRPTRWPFGAGWVDGYAKDLPDGSGFIGYAALKDSKTGEPFIGLLHLIWYGDVD